MAENLNEKGLCVNLGLFLIIITSNGLFRPKPALSANMIVTDVRPYLETN
ncbi:MAG: hypothetical protein Q8S39_10960 [Ignavibacteria bacterium]|nr:hypothetical protein [Ignavibacteria bacterium]